MTAPVMGNAAVTAVTDDSPIPRHSGVHLQHLRVGLVDEALFMVPGLEGATAELNALSAAFVGPQAVWAVAPTAPAEGEAVSMEAIAARMVAAIRQVQPSGPYRLGGYSFGALLALEMAQQIRSAGEAVEALFLVEAVYDERYWPRRIWLQALVRRSGRHLARIIRMNPVRAAGEVRVRGMRLVKRVMRRKTDAPDPLRTNASDNATMAGRALTAISGYRPRFYEGAMVLIASSIDRHFGCDTVRLWAGHAERLEVQRVDGDHVSVMNDPASAAAVANIIDHRLARERSDWTGVRPAVGFERPMLLTTMRWFSTARLAHALAEAGFTVSACRPKGHAIEVVEGLASHHRLRRVRRARSALAAIRAAGPDIILPDDERALALLRRLHAATRTSEPAVAALIARSLGPAVDWPVIASRTRLAEQARSLGVSAPRTEVIGDADALARWAAGHEPPIVLKTDGSWGGQGVAIIQDGSRLRGAWRRISNPVSLPRALKRLVFNLETGSLTAWVRRTRPVVNAQEFVDGRGAIATVACVEGTVQALVCLEVVQASQDKGPAAVVRIIDHPAMAEAAGRLVARFGLSGFCGFDFVITGGDEAHLLEVNPRVTPTCYLLVEGACQRNRTIALFPPDAIRGAVPGATDAEVLDVPVRAPSLVHRGDSLSAKRYRPVSRIGRRLKRTLIPSRY